MSILMVTAPDEMLVNIFGVPVPLDDAIMLRADWFCCGTGFLVPDEFRPGLYRRADPLHVSIVEEQPYKIISSAEADAATTTAVHTAKPTLVVKTGRKTTKYHDAIQVVMQNDPRR